MFRPSVWTRVSALILGLGLLIDSSWAGELPPVRIGAMATMFRETNAAKFAALAKAFCAAVEVETGSKCTLDFIADPADMRRQLSDGKIQLALVHGFEFAWMKQVDPNVKSLLIAAPVHRPIKAALVVSSRDPATYFAGYGGALHSLARIEIRWKTKGKR